MELSSNIKKDVKFSKKSFTWNSPTEQMFDLASSAVKTVTLATQTCLNTYEVECFRYKHGNLGYVTNCLKVVCQRGLSQLRVKRIRQRFFYYSAGAQLSFTRTKGLFRPNFNPWIQFCRRNSL